MTGHAIAAAPALGVNLNHVHREGGVEDFFRLIARAWPYLIVLVPGLWALWLRWTDLQKGRVTERTDLIKIAQEAAGDMIGKLREEADGLRERVDALEAELGQLQRLHTTMIADKDAKITLLEGEIRQLQAMNAAYEDLLVRNHIPLPKRGVAYWAVEGGHLSPVEQAPPPEG